MRDSIPSSSHRSHRSNGTSHANHDEPSPPVTAPPGEAEVLPPALPRTDAALDAAGAPLAREARTYRTHLPAANAAEPDSGDHKLKVGDWDAMWATLDVVDLRPRKFETDDGGGLRPFDSATPRGILQRYKSLENERAELVATVAAIDTEMARLGGTLQPVMSKAYDAASGVARHDATAAAVLKPATDHYGGPAAARAAHQRGERLLEQGMSESEIAARRVEQAQERKAKIDARQTARAARAGKRK